MTTNFPQGYLLKVQPRNTQGPATWWRIGIPTAFTLHDLDTTLRFVLGLADRQHEFFVSGRCYGSHPTRSYDWGKDDRRTQLREVLTVGHRFSYVYDLAAWQEFTIHVEENTLTHPDSPVDVRSRSRSLNSLTALRADQWGVERFHRIDPLILNVALIEMFAPKPQHAHPAGSNLAHPIAASLAPTKV